MCGQLQVRNVRKYEKIHRFSSKKNKDTKSTQQCDLSHFSSIYPARLEKFELSSPDKASSVRISGIRDKFFRPDISQTYTGEDGGEQPRPGRGLGEALAPGARSGRLGVVTRRRASLGGS